MTAHSVFRNRPILDLYILIFLASAAGAVWAAYDRETAGIRFSLLLVAALVYFLVTLLPARGIVWFAGLLSGIGASVAVLYLFSFTLQPGFYDFDILQHIASWWIGIRPVWPLPPLPYNVLGGILALFMPISLAFLMRVRKRLVAAIFSFSLCILSLAGLIMTSSLSAWLSLVVGLVVWALWWTSGRLSSRFAVDRHRILGIEMLGFILLSLALIFWLHGSRVNFTAQSTAVSRVELFRNSLHLVPDYPFTGAGLGSFPGVYSQYILKIPFFQFKNSHNLYLDVAIEQGLLALAMLGSLLVGSVWKVVELDQTGDTAWLQGPLLAGLAVMVIHGLMDDPLYANLGAPLLFLLPGLAVAVSRGRSENAAASLTKYWFQTGVRSEKRRKNNWKMVLFAPILLFVVTGALIWRREILGRWNANLGAVEMDRVELADFPSGQWKVNSNLEALAPALRRFEQALRYNPQDQTARYRLGLVALQAGDFQAAVGHLEAAFQVDRSHRGIRKALGQAYTWSGETGKALTLLECLPETRQEMDTYTWWWDLQGRQDLSQAASTLSGLLR